MFWYKLAVFKTRLDIDWGHVKELVLQGKSVLEIAHEYGASRAHMRNLIKRVFLNPESPFYDPEIPRRLNENGYDSLDIDWGRVKYLALQGKAISEIAHEYSVGLERLRRNIKRVFLNPESPFYDPEIPRRLNENGYARKLRIDQSPEARQRSSELYHQRWQNPEFREQMRERDRRRTENPEYRSRASDLTRQQWENPEFRQRMSEMWENPEYRQYMSEIGRQREADPERRRQRSEDQRRRMENPEYREQSSERFRQRWQDTEFRQQMAEVVRQQWENPEFRQRMSELSRQRWEDEEYRRQMLEVMNSPERSQQKSEELRRRWENPEFRRQMSELSRQRWENPEYRAMQMAMPVRSDFWNWLSQFDSDKQRQILNAIHAKNRASSSGSGQPVA